MAMDLDATDTAFKLDASERSATEPRLRPSAYDSIEVDMDDLTWKNSSGSTMQWSVIRKLGDDDSDDDDGPATLDDLTPGER